ncbi:hypothetical protein C8Q80DRAFT_1134355 [Daedaleopsis nitida]|nr:hypothetical protein C8Q80DRAFT_1134355 [Daedaleopsis nitida]
MNGGGGGGGAGLRGGARGYTERTPLLRPSPRRTYSESEDEGSEGMGEGERVARAAALRREEEAVFGKWPLRMFNRHVSISFSLSESRFMSTHLRMCLSQWWWWHLEPVLCCCCADEDDYEEF